MTAPELLTECQRHTVTLTVEGEVLRYRGAMTPKLCERIAQRLRSRPERLDNGCGLRRIRYRHGIGAEAYGKLRLSSLPIPKIKAAALGHL
jgi:hypothetical protein